MFINLLGCVGFMIAAAFSYIPHGMPNEDWTIIAIVCTLLGARCFLIGSLLMLPEGVTDAGETAFERR